MIKYSVIKVQNGDTLLSRGRKFDSDLNGGGRSECGAVVFVLESYVKSSVT